MTRSTTFFTASLLAALLAGAGPALAQRESETVQPKNSEPVANDPALRQYIAGNGLLSRGMYDLAAKEYRGFLAEHGDHPKANTARYGLGVALVRLKQYDQAAEALAPLRDVRDFEFANEARLLIAQCDLAQGKVTDARATLEDLAKSPNAPDDAAALLAETLYRAGEYESAESTARSLLERKPQSQQRDRVELLWGMASMARADYAHAAEHFHNVAERAPDTPSGQQAVVLCAQCLQQTGDFDTAASLFQKAASDKSSRFAADASVGLASLLRQQGHADQAAPILDDLLKDGGDSPAMTAAMMERARVDFDRGKFDQAQQRFEQAASRPGAQPDEAEYWIAKCALRAGHPADAASRLAKIVEDHPKSRLLPEISYDRAIAELRAGHDADAAKLLAEFRSKYPKHALAADALEAQANIEHRAGHYDQSLALCQQFEQSYPKHSLLPRVEFLASENLALTNQAREAIDDLKKFLADHADDPAAPRARLRLATLLFAQKQYDDARPLLEECAQAADKDPAFRPAVLCLGDLHFQKGEWADAERELAKYESFGDDAPSADDAALKRGLALSHLNRPDDALREFNRLVEKFPKSDHRLQAIFERAQTLTALGKTDDAKAAYKQVLKEGQGSPFAPYALTQLGSMSLSTGDATAAAQRFESAASMASDPQVKGEAIFQQGQSLLAAGQYEQAAETFEHLAKALPDHARAPEARAQRAISLSRINRDASALQAIEEAQADKSLDDQTRQTLAYERACCLRDLGKKDDATTAFRELAGEPNSAVAPYAMLDLAATESDAGQTDAAADLLTRVLASPQAKSARDLHDQATYRLAVCRYKQDQPRESLTLVEGYLKSDPKGDLVPAAMLLAGECNLKLGRATDAARNFRKVVDDSPKDPAAATALLRLGDALAASQDWPGSEQAFSRYLKENPDSELWFQAQFGLGWARENQGRTNEAIESYRKVTDKHNGPTAARAQFQIGECLFAQKKYQDAAAELLKVDILYAYPEWSAGALYEAGRCLESLGKRDEAVAQFQQVKTKYPDTKWAGLAAGRLNASAPAPH